MDKHPVNPEDEPAAGSGSGPRDSLSMHANVPVWCDCCSCEVEPYWLEAFNVKGDEEARQQFVDILEVMGPDDPRTAKYRKLLTARLF